MSDPISSKEKVLKKLRKALLQKDIFFNPDLDFDTDVFVREEGSLADVFAKNLKDVSGKVVFCKNHYHFMDMFLSLVEFKGWQDVICLEEDLKSMLNNAEFPIQIHAGDAIKADASITGCDALIARTGSVLVSSKSNLSRAINSYPSVHIVLAYRDQLIYGLKEYFKKNDGAQSSSWNIITGPSRTSDIERTLVLGAHGPKELYVFIMDEDKGM